MNELDAMRQRLDAAEAECERLRGVAREAHAVLTPFEFTGTGQLARNILSAALTPDRPAEPRNESTVERGIREAKEAVDAWPDSVKAAFADRPAEEPDTDPPKCERSVTREQALRILCQVTDQDNWWEMACESALDIAEDDERPYPSIYDVFAALGVHRVEVDYGLGLADTDGRAATESTASEAAADGNDSDGRTGTE